MNYIDVLRVESKQKNLFGKMSTVYVAYNREGQKVPAKLVSTTMRQEAFDTNQCILVNTDGGLKLDDISQFDSVNLVDDTPVVDNSSIEVPSDHAEVLSFIHNSYSLKPKGLMMTELKWKYLIRSAVRGKNIMMTGPAGCGKTMAAKSVVNSLDRPDFYFNLGATQDPRATLIGNTHFNSESGTYFSESLFVKAIQTPNAVVLLDELS